MAAGYYDAEGVWIYGEDDAIALFSDLLNMGENSVSDQFTADRSRITAVEASLGVRFPAASSTARDAHFGVPANDTQRLALQNAGSECIRTDLGYSEAYFATYNASTNPGGATPYGWYPLAGALPNLAYTTNASQSVTNTGVTVTFAATNTMAIAQGITFNAATGVATIVSAGNYQITGKVNFAASTSGSKQLAIQKNATNIVNNLRTTAAIDTLEINAVLKLAAGDTISLFATATVTTATETGNFRYTSLFMNYVSPAR